MLISTSSPIIEFDSDELSPDVSSLVQSIMRRNDQPTCETTIKTVVTPRWKGKDCRPLCPKRARGKADSAMLEIRNQNKTQQQELTNRT